MPALRIGGAAAGEGVDQRLCGSGQRRGAQIEAFILQPLQQQHSAGGGVEPDPIGQASIAGGVVRQHHGHPALRHRHPPQTDPTGCELSAPADGLSIGLIALNRALQGLIGLAQFLEAADAGGEPAIQLRQGHLHRQIQRRESNAALLPALTRSGAAEQLQHRHAKLSPQGCTGGSLIGFHRGKPGAAQHGLHLFMAEPVLHSALNRF